MSEVPSGSPENTVLENTPQQIAGDIKNLASPNSPTRLNAKSIIEEDELRAAEIDRIADKVISNLKQAQDHQAREKFGGDLARAFFGTIGPTPGMHQDVFESYTDVMLRTATKLGERQAARSKIATITGSGR